MPAYVGNRIDRAPEPKGSVVPISEKRSALARHAAAVRWDKPNQAETARDLATARIAEYIERVVDSAPPLTAEQRDRIAALLRPTAGASE